MGGTSAPRRLDMTFVYALLIAASVFCAHAEVICHVENKFTVSTCHRCSTPFPVDNLLFEAGSVSYASVLSIGLNYTSQQDNTLRCRSLCLSDDDCKAIKIVSVSPFTCNIYKGSGSLSESATFTRKTNVLVNITFVCPAITKFRINPFIAATGAEIRSYLLPNISTTTCEINSRITATLWVTALTPKHGPVIGKIEFLSIGIQNEDLTALQVTAWIGAGAFLVFLLLINYKSDKSRHAKWG